MDAERARARALLRVLARSCNFVDALECGELDYDGCSHGWRQLSGLSPSPLPSLFTPLIKPVCLF